MGKGNTKHSKGLAAVMMFALWATACGGTQTDSSTTALEKGLPGEGISVVMARANWATGYFQAELVRRLMQMLGYEVSDPADAELGPSLAYLAMAQGDADFWVNSWYPNHNSWLRGEMPDGSLVSEHVRRIGGLLAGSALQGYLITKSFADEYEIATLDDLDNNPEALAAYDAVDIDPGNGIADIYGCPEGWTCDDVIQSQIAFSGWENIRQVIAGYEAMVTDAIAKVDAGEPTVIYIWTPSSYIAQLRPGDNVYWLAVEEVLDDSNPLGREGGEGWDQRPGTAPIDGEACPDVEARGACHVGWEVADIVASARHDFLDENPAAAKLLEVVKLNIVDVTQQIIEHENGADIDDLVSRWIADNQEQVDGWIAEAMAAA